MARRKLLITGAAGGMGRACARLLGASRDLILTDISSDALDGFAEELRREGFSVAAHPGDLCDEGLLRPLAGMLGGGPFDLVHTAGISPSQSRGDWRTVVRVNWVGTEKLLRAIEPQLAPGSAAVLIASSGGYAVPAIPEVDAILGNPLGADFETRFGALVERMGAAGGEAGLPGIVYAFSKRAVLRTVEARAAAWGAKGARIVSISPGTILTPMGRLELETPQVAEITQRTPLGRAASPIDIAFGARFLLGEEAGFITGCDLLIDGGGTGAARGPFGPAGAGR